MLKESGFTECFNFLDSIFQICRGILCVVMPNFATRVEIAVDAISSNPPKDVDENEFIDASRLVYDGVREIRRAVLMNRVSMNNVFISEPLNLLA